MRESSTAARWYRTADDFKQLCLDAKSQAQGENAEEFTHQMLQNAVRYGLDTYISEPQLRWLCRIADHYMPRERT